MADLVRNPAFAEEELDRQRTQTLDSLKVALSTPGQVLSQAVGRVVYGNAPYGSPGVGTVTSLPAITRDDIVAFHAARYRPEAATLVFSGDITEAQARALAQSAFGDWAPAGVAAAAIASPAGQSPWQPRIIVIDQPGAGQAAVAVAMRSVPRATADYFPLTLGNTLLGGSFTSRLNQEIRIKRGLSYGTRSSLGLRRDTGAFVASAQTRNDAAPEVADLILAEIVRLGATAPTDRNHHPSRHPDRRLQRLAGDRGRAGRTGRRPGAVRPADERSGGLCEQRRPRRRRRRRSGRLRPQCAGRPVQRGHRRRRVEIPRRPARETPERRGHSAVEPEPRLVFEIAGEALTEAGVTTVVAPVTEPSGGDYDVIVSEMSTPVRPEAWLKALKVGGRLVVVERPGPAGKAVLYVRGREGLSRRELFDSNPQVMAEMSPPMIFAL
jgi:hypothetical protein